MTELSRRETPLWNWDYNTFSATYSPGKDRTLELYIEHVLDYKNGLKKFYFSACILEPNGHIQVSRVKKFKAKNMEQAIRYVEKFIYKNYIVSILWDQVKYNDKSFMDDSEYEIIDKSL